LLDRTIHVQNGPTRKRSRTSKAHPVSAGDAVWTAIERPEFARRFIVTGMRRIGVTPSGRVVHVNDLPALRHGDYYDKVVARIDLLERASSLVLSLENHRIDERFERSLALSVSTQRIHIRRSTLNLLASRIEGLRRSERLGRKGSGLENTQRLLDTMTHNRTSLPESWTVVDFDQWLTEGATYRRSILDALGLTADIDPAMSRHGDGSSFTARRRVPTPAELTSRWSTIKWPTSIVELLLRPRNFGLLAPEEVEVLLEVPTVD
jgi:hypothetical protein